MKGDFTSFRNGHYKSYTGVLRQQGRVDLDADWNEYVGIQEHLRRTIEKDVIGACGVPKHAAGFAVDWDAARGDLTISAGRIYVDGILCELEDETSYLGQPHYPSRPALDPVDGRTDLIYLDVWQRHVTAVEDPAIREVALGGPDTTTRLQTVWQVKVLEGVGNVGCADEIQGWPPAPGTGRLSTQETTAIDPEDPCLIAPGGGYRGLENRLYRVEIHRGSGSGGSATFKWSRDNGSVVFPIERFVPGEPTKVIVSRLGRDQVLALREGDRVEVAGDDPELDGAPGLLTRIENIDRARRELTLADDVSGVAGQQQPKVRRWDQTETEDTAGLDEGGRRVREDEWLDLEDGVQVRFKAGQSYRSGDYWAFTARTATGKVERLVEAEPRSVDHHYCRLALVTWSVDGTVDAEVQDCRKEFPPLTELPTGGASCCTVTVGDGILSEGNFTDIQTAVDAVQGPGRVCILPGEYRLAQPVVIRKRGLVVSGCGIQARIVGPDDEPAFQVEDSLGIWLGSLYIESRATPGAIAVNDSDLVFVKNCFVSSRQLFPESREAERVEVRRLRTAGERILGAEISREIEEEEEGMGPSLTVSSSSHVVVADNYFLSGWPSLSIQARDLRVLRNVSRGAGGVWIRDGSSGVRIEANDIGEGQGPGIKLGGLAEGETPPVVATGVVGADIVGNRIFSMGDSGIEAGAAERKTPDDAAKGLGDVEDVTIARNRIVGCARKGRRASSEFDAVGGIVLNDASGVLIHENYIAENGDGPACGVFAHTCQSLEVTDNTIVDNGTAQAGEPQQECIDFREMSTGEGDNPRTEQDIRFTVFEPEGNPSNQTSVVNWGGMTGLNCRFQTDIDLPAPTPLVELTLATFAGSATIEALDADGTTIDRQPVRDDLGSQPQSFALDGGEISRVRIRAPSNEVLLHEFCSGAEQTSFQGGIVGLFVTGARSQEGRRFFRTGSPAARIHDNVVVTPQGHALLLIVAGPVSVAANSFTSRGIGRQPEFLGRLQGSAGLLAPVLQGGACAFVYNVGRAPLLPGAFSRLGSDTSVHAERMFRPTESTLGLAAAVSDRLLPDGRVLFHDNQVTLEATNTAPEPGFIARAVAGVSRLNPGAVVLFSFDDVSLQDNQVVAEISGGAVFFNAAAVAPTVRVSGNRFAEVPLAFYSCVSWGQKNNTTGNQATHCILALGTDVIEDHNQMLFITALCADLKADVEGTRG